MHDLSKVRLWPSKIFACTTTNCFLQSHALLVSCTSRYPQLASCMHLQILIACLSSMSLPPAPPACLLHLQLASCTSSLPPAPPACHLHLQVPTACLRTSSLSLHLQTPTAYLLQIFRYVLAALCFICISSCIPNSCQTTGVSGGVGGKQ